MNMSFDNKRISGILAVLPENEIAFEDEINNYSFPPAQSLRLKKVMGFEKHRIVKPATAPSDLAIWGLNSLFDKGPVNAEDISALIVVTQTPDYFLPPTSSIIQGHTKLNKHTLCIDINQPCAGFLVGIMQGFMMLDNPAINKVALVNIDVLSKKVSKQDRNSYPLIGDAASVTILERSGAPSKACFNYFSYGEMYEALIIPAGGFKMPSTAETSVMQDIDGDGNFRSLDNLKMDGSAVYNFVMQEVPGAVSDILKFSGYDREQIDWFMFHQPNRFMLEKLADKLAVPREKMPNNIVSNFGNSSGVTIPVNIAFNLGNILLDKAFMCCLCGFGGGLTLSSAVLPLGNMAFCETCISPF